MTSIKAYIISIKDNTARRDELRERFGAIGITPQFIDATRGENLSAAEKSGFNTRQRQIRHGHIMQDNAIGCALSHHRAWQAIMDSDAGCGFIFEDDATPLGDDTKALMGELVGLADHLDIVTLVNMRAGMKGEMIRPCGKSSALYLLKGNDFGAVGYFITAGAAARLLRHPLIHQYEVDFLMHHWWNHQCQLLHLLPPLFDEDGRPSSIGHDNNIPWPDEGLWVKLQRRVMRLKDSALKRALYPRRLRAARRRLSAG
jgi:glycosyl transferase family 25